MSIAQIVEVVSLIIDSRTVVGNAYISREPGSRTYEVRARLCNHDGIGCKDTLLAAFDDSDTAVQVKNAI
jgi:hypothetical protein